MKLNKKFISRLKDKDESSFEELFNEYAPLLKAMAYRYTKNKDIADDLVQETFIIIYHKIGQYHNSGSFEGWIKRILINNCLNYLKLEKKNLYQNIDNFDKEEKKIDKEVNTKDAKSLIKYVNFSEKEIIEAVSELSEGYRVIFNLYVLEGFKHKQIAEILGISESTSKTQLLRARKMLQKILYEKAKQKFAANRQKKFKDLLIDEDEK